MPSSATSSLGSTAIYPICTRLLIQLSKVVPCCDYPRDSNPSEADDEGEGEGEDDTSGTDDGYNKTSHLRRSKRHKYQSSDGRMPFLS